MTRTVTYAEFVPVLRELQEQGRPIFAVALADGGYRISYGNERKHDTQTTMRLQEMESDQETPTQTEGEARSERGQELLG